jgi:biopolymer transport protein ExbD
VAEVASSQETVIQPLKAALQSQADSVLADAAKQDLAEREVTILGDRGTPYSVLRKVMATCTDADYGKVSLAVIERERAPTVARSAALTG